jgi:uncharacterized membrane protein YfcA
MSASVLIAAGFLPALVSASVHSAEMCTTLVSGISHLRLGNIDKAILLPLASSGIVGGVLGAYTLASLVSGSHMRPVVGLLLLLLGMGIVLKALQGKIASHQTKGFSKKLLMPLGLLAGSVDAVGGGGWGPITTSALVIRNQTTPRYVVGSVNLAEFFVTVAIVLTFGVTLGFRSFLWHITLPLIIGGVLIAPVAAYTSRRVSPMLMGVAIGLLLIVLNAKTVYQSLSHTLGLSLPVYFDSLVIAVGGLMVTLLVIGAVVQSRRISPKRKEASAAE